MKIGILDKLKKELEEIKKLTQNFKPKIQIEWELRSYWVWKQVLLNAKNHESQIDFNKIFEK